MRVVESGIVSADCSLPARFAPKIATIDPGATGPWVKLAAFTTALSGTTGVWATSVSAARAKKTANWSLFIENVLYSD